MPDALNIVIDTREQTPWSWSEHKATTSIHGLAACDYALAEDCFAVDGHGTYGVRFGLERKSLEDMLGTISSGWDRFLRELDRMQGSGFPARIVIVEGNFSEFCFMSDDNGIHPPSHNHPRLLPAFVARRIAELSMMGVAVLFAGSAEYAAALAYRIFRERCRNMEENHGRVV